MMLYNKKNQRKMDKILIEAIKRGDKFVPEEFIILRKKLLKGGLMKTKTKKKATKKKATKKKK